MKINKQNDKIIIEIDTKNIKNKQKVEKIEEYIDYLSTLESITNGTDDIYSVEERPEYFVKAYEHAPEVKVIDKRDELVNQLVKDIIDLDEWMPKTFTNLFLGPEPNVINIPEDSNVGYLVLMARYINELNKLIRKE